MIYHGIYLIVRLNLCVGFATIFTFKSVTFYSDLEHGTDRFSYFPNGYNSQGLPVPDLVVSLLDCVHIV